MEERKRLSGLWSKVHDGSCHRVILYSPLSRCPEPQQTTFLNAKEPLLLVAEACLGLFLKNCFILHRYFVIVYE
jgi:hypothetical protein